MKKLVIYGAGFSNIIKLIDKINAQKMTWEVVGFLDDEKYGVEQKFMGYRILGDRKAVNDFDKDIYFINNVASTMHARELVAGALQDVSLATLVSPQVDVNYVTIGKGTVIHDGVNLGANVTIGSNCVLRWNAQITHDNKLADFTFVGPGAILCGYVSTGTGAYIGAGSTIKERITIGSWATVGMGSAVIKNVLDYETVIGVPAKSKRTH